MTRFLNSLTLSPLASGIGLFYVLSSVQLGYPADQSKWSDSLKRCMDNAPKEQEKWGTVRQLPSFWEECFKEKAAFKDFSECSASADGISSKYFREISSGDSYQANKSYNFEVDVIKSACFRSYFDNFSDYGQCLKSAMSFHDLQSESKSDCFLRFQEQFKDPAQCFAAADRSTDHYLLERRTFCFNKFQGQFKTQAECQYFADKTFFGKDKDTNLNLCLIHTSPQGTNDLKLSIRETQLAFCVFSAFQEQGPKTKDDIMGGKTCSQELGALKDVLVAGKVKDATQRIDGAINAGEQGQLAPPGAAGKPAN